LPSPRAFDAPIMGRFSPTPRAFDAPIMGRFLPTPRAFDAPNFQDTLIRFDRIDERDGHPERQTDGHHTTA